MYIPKNRIITDLKTSPNEFVYKGTNTFYNGFYWKSYDGKIYTGKNPNDFPTREIETYVNVQDYDTLTSPPLQSQILFTDLVEPFIGSENNTYSEELVTDYSIYNTSCYEKNVECSKSKDNAQIIAINHKVKDISFVLPTQIFKIT